MNLSSPLMRFVAKTAITLVVLVVLGFLFDKVIMPFYTLGGEIVKVPNVCSLSINEAEAKLSQSGLAPKLGYNRYDKTRELNTVLSQNPTAGSSVKKGRHVYLSVNKKSQKPISLPDYKGRIITDVKLSLEKIGLELGEINYSIIYSEDQDGMVLSQSIPPKTLLAGGTEVNFTVGKMAVESGQKQSLVPDLTGVSLSEAQKIIIDNSFSLGNVSFRFSSSLIPNTIINQKPASGQVAPLGKPIDIVVATDKQTPIN